jgi:hypothetical protein
MLRHGHDDPVASADVRREPGLQCEAASDAEWFTGAEGEKDVTSRETGRRMGSTKVSP